MIGRCYSFAYAMKHEKKQRNKYLQTTLIEAAKMAPRNSPELAIAFLVKETGEYGERRRSHSDGETEKFYRDQQLRGVRVQVGMEATCYSRWFERLLAELGFEVWIGDPAEIQGRRGQEAKDRPERSATAAAAEAGRSLSADLGTSSGKSRCVSTAVARASASADAMNEGCRSKKKLFCEQGREHLEKLALAPWASRRRLRHRRVVCDRPELRSEISQSCSDNGACHDSTLRALEHQQPTRSCFSDFQ